MPQRCICLQSNIGAANWTGGTLMSPGFSPPRMRMATAAVCRLVSATRRSGPPTISARRRICHNKNWRICNSVQPRQWRATFVHDACRIDDHQLPETPTVAQRNSLLELSQMTNDRSMKAGSGSRAARLLGYRFPPELFYGRSANDHHHTLCVRQHSQDIFDGSKIVDPDRDNGVVGCKVEY